MNFSHKTKNKHNNLEFWCAFREKLGKHFDEKTAKKISGEGLLCPLNVTSKTVKFLYEPQDYDLLRSLLSEITEKLKLVISYILPNIKKIYFVPESALNKANCVLENYKGAPPIILIIYH